MGFSLPRLPKEPTIRTCKSCQGPIYYVAGVHRRAKAIGYVHLRPGDWLFCPVPSGEARPKEKAA